MLKAKQFLAILLLNIVAMGAFADTPLSTGELAMPLQNSGVSARALGLGSAFVGVADDASALLWNPAGLSQLKSFEVGLHHNSGLGDTVQETGVAAFPTGGFGGFGLSINYVNNGNFEGRDANGGLTGGYTVGDMGGSLGWGGELARGLALGVNLKGNQQTLGPQNYSAFGADAGILWLPAPGLCLGLAYSNLGGAVAGSPLASALRGGASFSFATGQANRVLLAAAGSIEPNGVNRVQGGLEDTLYSLLALRAGYQMDMTDNQLSGLTGLTAGLGFIFKSFKVDYAYLPFGELGVSQRISLSYVFGNDEPAAGLKTESKAEASATGTPAGKTSQELLKSGLAMQDQGKNTQAMALFRQAVQKDGHNAEAWRNLGRLYLKTGHADYAKSCYTQVLKILPGDPEANQFLSNRQK